MSDPDDAETFYRVPPQRRRDYDPWADPDYPLNRLAATDGAPRPPRRSPDRQSWPDVLNWRTHGHQIYPPLTPQRAAVMACVPFYWPLLALELAQPLVRAMEMVR